MGVGPTQTVGCVLYKRVYAAGDIKFRECSVDGQRHHVTIRETNMATSSL